MLYAGIGHEVARRGYDSVSSRAVVPARRKMALLMRAFAGAVPPRGVLAMPPLPEAAFLVRAAVTAPLPVVAPRRKRTARLPSLGIDERMGWLIDLFARLEQREQMGRTGA
jgi:phytoene synthase